MYRQAVRVLYESEVIRHVNTPVTYVKRPDSLEVDCGSSEGKYRLEDTREILSAPKIEK